MATAPTLDKPRLTTFLGGRGALTFIILQPHLLCTFYQLVLSLCSLNKQISLPNPSQYRLMARIGVKGKEKEKWRKYRQLHKKKSDCMSEQSFNTTAETLWMPSGNSWQNLLSYCHFLFSPIFGFSLLFWQLFVCVRVCLTHNTKITNSRTRKWKPETTICLCVALRAGKGRSPAKPVDCWSYHKHLSQQQLRKEIHIKSIIA